MVDVAMRLAFQQLRRGGYFVFEHPSGATSWRLPSVLRLAAHRSVGQWTTHLCQFDLRSPDGSKRLRKSTTLMSNLPPAIMERHL
eukprot:10119679-Prorocentrum_lima.AAC.1